MKNLNRTFLAVLFGIGILLIFPVTDSSAQSEKILSFHSDIDLHLDGSMTVTETIKVICAGEEIRRGIFRTFPTKYKGRYGNTVRVLFEVVEILKDGEPEPYHTEKMANGVKVYVGSSDVYLPYGEYTYTLVYRTDQQIGFFKDFDELYWNVTGLDWGFVIDKAEAVIRLPRGAEMLNTAGYTGPKGAQGQDYTVGTDYSGNIRFTTTRPLPPYEGLTVAVAFTKGIIPEPTAMEKASRILKGNPGGIAAFAGLCMLLLYYIFAWYRVGKDPRKGTIIPQFSPPEGYSPAATRFVMRMGYSDRAFAASVVNMAVKGFVSIEEKKSKFTLTRLEKDPSALDKGEKQILDKLFNGGKSIEFEQKNHLKIQAAVQALKNNLKMNFEKMNFRRNGSYIIPGFLITLATLAAVVFAAPVREGAIFMAIWLSGWTVGCLFLVKMALTEWKSVFSGGGLKGGGAASAIAITLFALPFLVFELVGMLGFSVMASSFAAGLLLSLILLNIVFAELMKAPTIYGRQIMDQIEGFRMYLQTAEEEKLKILTPAKTPALFEKYLPYALALDVENAWTKKFEDVLAQAGRGTEYSPTWYSGTSWSRGGISGLTSSLGSSFSSTISSSSRAPGSSSGSGGGGSSGGGGGGGGGGGW